MPKNDNPDEFSEATNSPQLNMNDFLDKGFIDGILPDSVYRTILSSDSSELNLVVTLIEKRLNDIEDKVFKTARKSETTRAQQMLLLKHLGMLDRIIDLPIKGFQKARLLSILLNASAENIEGDLSHIQNDNAPDLVTSRNYNFLLATFKEVDLSDKATEMDNILSKINKKTSK